MNINQVIENAVSNALAKAFEGSEQSVQSKPEVQENHPMWGRKCLIRTYSAGVHIGTIDYIAPGNSMEIRLKDSIRLWKWENGGLSLSAIANEGIKGGRLNKTGEVYLTNAIEIIPVTEKAEKTYAKFIE